MELSREQIANSLRHFKSRRDSLLHDDVGTFEHQLSRFLEFCDQDSLANSVLQSADGRGPDADAWCEAATKHEPETSFPPNADDEFALRLALLRSAAKDPNRIFQLGIANRQNKRDGWVEFFRTGSHHRRKPRSSSATSL